MFEIVISSCNCNLKVTCAKLNMWVISQISILDRSRPGLTMNATGTGGQEGTGGNYATDGQKRRRRVGDAVSRDSEKSGRVRVWRCESEH